VPGEQRPRPVTITAEAASLRRELGPTAWVVLEIVVASADDDGQVFVSPAEIALVAGLNVDTVQRALRRLRDAQLMTVDDARVAGRFAGTRRSLGFERLRGGALIGVVSLPDAPDAVSPDTATSVTETIAAVESPSISRRATSTRRASHSSTPASIPSLFEGA
jgi:hypothetical protein